MSRTTTVLAALVLLAAGTLLVPPTPSVATDEPAAARVAQTRVIGTTAKGRRLVAQRIGDPASARKVVLIATMHGNEKGPRRLLATLRDGRPITGADVWIVPTMNPDGAARSTRKNARGVDLNRNFPHRWKRLTGRYHSGRAPASERETQAVMRFLREVRPSMVVSFHQPLRGVGRSGVRKGVSLQRRLSRQLELPLKSFNCNGGCHGTMTEWFNHHFRGVAITVEYGHGMTKRQLRRGPDRLLAAIGARR